MRGIVSSAHLLHHDLLMADVIERRVVFAEDRVVDVHRQVRLVNHGAVLHVVEGDEAVRAAADSGYSYL